MSDTKTIGIDAIQPSKEDLDSNNLLLKDQYGDVVQSYGTRMLERESYERVIEGMKISSDAAQHLARLEGNALWVFIASKLDEARKICARKAGLGDEQRQGESAKRWSGEVMRYKDARSRFRYGLQQAAGGMRQLSTCFRMDLSWSAMARDLESMQRKLAQPGLGLTKGGLVVPGSMLH